jgi:phosphatidylcholine synthase
LRPSRVRFAWSVHLFTGSGVIVGILALDAVLQQRARTAMVLLLVTQIIDGLDGPMARAADVQNCAPRIDGYVLDLVIDYVTCVVVPAMFMHEFNLLPEGSSLFLIGFVVFTSAMWFSRTDMMTDDHWFRGFPAVWNLVAPSFYLLKSPHWFTVGVTVLLAAMSFTNVPFPHPVRVVRWRLVTLPITTCWVAAMGIAILYRDPADIAWWLEAWLIIGPLYFVALAGLRMLEDRRPAALATTPAM